MSPLSCLLATISLIAPTCRGVMGVFRHPAMMVLVSFYPLVTSWGRFFVGHRVNAPRSGSVYTSPNAPNVRTLNGHIKIPLGDVASAGMLGQWNFDVAVQRSDVRGVRAGVE